MLYSGSLVFTLPAHPVDLRDWRVLWGVSIQGQVTQCSRLRTVASAQTNNPGFGAEDF
jgi:hypothetical protein